MILNIFYILSNWHIVCRKHEKNALLRDAQSIVKHNIVQEYASRWFFEASSNPKKSKSKLSGKEELPDTQSSNVLLYSRVLDHHLHPNI